MAYQKLQAGRAIAVVPSDDFNVPNPAATAASGTTTADGRATNQLIQAGATFLTDNIKAGDIIYAGTSIVSPTIAATVVSVLNDTTINVENSTGGAASAFNTALEYTIFSQADNPQNGCCLFIGDISGGGRVKVNMAAGDDTVNFRGLVAGQFLPINVLRVWATDTTAAEIVALW